MSPDSSSFACMSPSSSIPVMTVDGTPMTLAGVGSVVMSRPEPGTQGLRHHDMPVTIVTSG